MKHHNAKAQAFEQWVIAHGKSAKTAKNYASTVKGSITQWAVKDGLIDESLFDIADNRSLNDITAKIRLLDIFVERNKKGKGMYGAALNWYGDYIRDFNNTDIAADIEDIYLQKGADKTEREALVSTRLGQGQFRDGLITYWGRCAATGYKQQNLLIASHIKPWRDSSNQERLDPFNGFLFIPNIDKAFDKNFISFKAGGEILISSELEEPERLGMDASMKIDLADQHQAYLEYHRDEMFRV